MNNHIYTGIGSRGTPREVRQTMTNYAKLLGSYGWTLRSGAADGADRSFERGADEIEGPKEIYLPWKGFNRHTSSLHLPPAKAYTYAAEIYGDRWRGATDSTKDFMARNIQQVLGQLIDTPTRFVICWTPDGCNNAADRTKETGGTGQAIACASLLDIPVFNLFNTEDERALKDYLRHILDIT